MKKIDSKELPYIMLITLLLGVIIILGSAVNFLGKSPTGQFMASSTFYTGTLSQPSQPPQPALLNRSGICIGPWCIDILPPWFPDECNVTGPLILIPGIFGQSWMCDTVQATHAGCVLGQCVELLGSAPNECTLNSVCTLNDADKALENAVLFALWAVEADNIIIEDEDIQQGAIVTQTGDVETGQLTIQGSGLSGQQSTQNP